MKNKMEHYFTDEQMIEHIYNYFCHYQSFNEEDRGAYIENGNAPDIEDQLYAYTIDIKGYSGFPIVLSDDDYKKLKTPELYHGWKDKKHAENFLTCWNYHHGRGAYGNGFYIAEKFDNAICFTDNRNGTYSTDRVMRLKLAPNCKGINSKDVYSLCYHMEIQKKIDKKRHPNLDDDVIDKCNMIQNFFKTIEDKDQLKRFISAFISSDYSDSYSAFLAFLGYDYIKRDNMYEGEYCHITLFNRGKLLVNEKTYNHFTNPEDEETIELDYHDIYG